MGCAKCGGWVKHREILDYRDDAKLGVPGVVLVNGVTANVCSECRDADVTIPNLAGAIAAAGIARVMHPVKLTGAELSAVRRAAGYTAKDLADALDVPAETVSRWETGAEPTANEESARVALGKALDQGAAPSLVAFDSHAVFFPRDPARRSDGRPPEIRLELVRVGQAASAGAWKLVTP